MPGLIAHAGDVPLVLGIADDEAVGGTIFREPDTFLRLAEGLGEVLADQVPVDDIKGQARLVLRRAARQDIPIVVPFLFQA